MDILLVSHKRMLTGEPYCNLRVKEGDGPHALNHIMYVGAAVSLLKYVQESSNFNPFLMKFA